MKPRIYTEQAITAFANKYALYGADEQGNKAQLIAFAQQKRIALKEKITFYSDKSKASVVCTMHAEKVMDVHGRYIVEDAEGNTVGAFKKLFKQSLFVSTWHILGADDQPLFEIKESNVILALLRRFGSFVPIVGEIIDLIVALFKYHFVIRAVDSGEVVGTYQKRTLFRDHYVLSMTDAAYDAVDSRTLAAYTVALDVLQSR